MGEDSVDKAEVQQISVGKEAKGLFAPLSKLMDKMTEALEPDGGNLNGANALRDSAQVQLEMSEAFRRHGL